MKYILLLSLVLTVFISLPANASTIYSHVTVSSGTVNSGHATGAPDGNATTFSSTNAWVEPGFPQASSGNVTMQYTVSTDDAYSVTVKFMNGASVEHTALVLFIGTAPTGITIIENPTNVTFDRVHIIPQTPLFGIDAVWITTENTTPPTTPSSSTPSATTNISSENVSPLFPRLIKLQSDNDPITQHDTAVYVIDPNTGKRRPFFNDTIYRSWFGLTFDRVETVTTKEMASYSLGPSMFMHPGTYLVKVQSMDAVYAVERGGLLRYIPSETIAKELYGANWSNLVRDISPTDWPRYTVGQNMASIFPDDTLVMDGHLITWHIRNGIRRQIPFSDLAYHGGQLLFTIPYGAWFGEKVADERLSIYTIGSTYTRADDIGLFGF